MVLFEQQGADDELQVPVLKECDNWYYLNFNELIIFSYAVLKECDNWYYLNDLLQAIVQQAVLKECDNWYYLNETRNAIRKLKFLRNAIIGII